MSDSKDRSNPYAAPKGSTDEPTVVVRSSAREQRDIARRRIFVAGTLSLIVGMASRLMKPLVSGPVHFEALAAILLNVFFSLVLFGVVRRFPFIRALVALQIGLFVIWFAYLAGWSIMNGGLWDDVVGISAAMWIVSAFVGLGLLFVQKRWLK